MRVSPETDRSRRDFFRSAGRYGFLGLLLGAAGLATRGGKAGAECVNRGYCPPCALADTCVLPAALSRRQALVQAQAKPAADKPINREASDE